MLGYQKKLYQTLCCLFLHSFHFLLFFQEFFHMSFSDFLNHLPFVKYWMTFVASFNLDRSRNCSIYSKFCTTNTLYFHILVVFSMNVFLCHIFNSSNLKKYTIKNNTIFRSFFKRFLYYSWNNYIIS